MFIDGHLIGRGKNENINLGKTDCEEDFKMLDNKLRGREL